MEEFFVSQEKSFIRSATIVVNFTNILREAFSPNILQLKSTNLKCSHRKYWKTLLYEKAAFKMLMKLIPGNKVINLGNFCME